jgi:succinate dehydrogenase / fumarate reductase iron-sulfur subunit
MSDTQNTTAPETRKITVKAFRFNAETDYLPYYKT